MLIIGTKYFYQIKVVTMMKNYDELLLSKLLNDLTVLLFVTIKCIEVNDLIILYFTFN